MARRWSLVWAVSLGLPFGIACSKGREAATKKELATAQATIAALTSKVDSLTKERDVLADKISTLETQAVISNEHVMFDRALELERAGELEHSLVWYRDFLEHYPKSALADNVRGKVAGLEKAAEAVRKVEQERIDAQALDTVSVAQMVGDIRSYKGKLIVRLVQCLRIGESLDGTPTSSCDIDSALDSSVNYDSSSVKLLSTFPRDAVGQFTYRGVFKVWGAYDGRLLLRFVRLAPN